MDDAGATLSATFDVNGTPQAMSSLVYGTSGDDGSTIFTSIFGLQLASTTAGSYDFSWGTNSVDFKGSISLYQLSGATLSGYASGTDTVSSGTSTVELTGLTNGSYIVSGMSTNSNSGNLNNSGGGTVAQMILAPISVAPFMAAYPGPISPTLVVTTMETL